MPWHAGCSSGRRDIDEHPADDPERIAAARVLRAALADAERYARAGRLMAGLGGVSFVAALLVFRVPRLSGGLMVAAAIAPALVAPAALLFGFLLLLSAVLAFASTAAGEGRSFNAFTTENLRLRRPFEWARIALSCSRNARGGWRR